MLLLLQGTIHLVDAAKSRGVKDFVLLSSLLTNAPAMGQKDNPNYKFLNILGGILEHKLVSCGQVVFPSACLWAIAVASIQNMNQVLM